MNSPYPNLFVAIISNSAISCHGVLHLPVLDLQGDYHGLELHDGTGRRPQLSTLLVWAFFSDRLTIVAAKHVRLDSKIELSESAVVVERKCTATLLCQYLNVIE